MPEPPSPHHQHSDQEPKMSLPNPTPSASRSYEQEGSSSSSPWRRHTADSFPPLNIHSDNKHKVGRCPSFSIPSPPPPPLPELFLHPSFSFGFYPQKTAMKICSEFPTWKRSPLRIQREPPPPPQQQILVIIQRFNNKLAAASAGGDAILWIGSIEDSRGTHYLHITPLLIFMFTGEFITY